jgi:PBP1b-binding outer membrane lipoprotein LpoB
VVSAKSNYRSKQKTADSIIQQGIRDDIKRNRQKVANEQLQADSTETDTATAVKPPGDN